MSIYKDTFTEMQSSLKETINEVEKSFDAKSLIPLFSISNRKLEFMNTILHFSHYQALRVVKKYVSNFVNVRG